MKNYLTTYKRLITSDRCHFSPNQFSYCIFLYGIYIKKRAVDDLARVDALKRAV